ncbi:Uncharacterised protein [Serratia quinivorans]|uniref:hypothetical protein n=1 Tax=Serratia quinivorans TaxID=137545 RepID=UPI002177A8F4|nr:hypothetical protein [Serratia quinivorans]CAI1628095.1 Uncharacterised protein [Serratia quinivorans]
MESLEIPEKVISLGKKLVSSLKDSDPDEITVWMINYLAEKIVMAESGSEVDKRNCFDVILKLWGNRSLLPDGSRPFESFEPVFRALDSLSPESNNYHYMKGFYNDEPNVKLNESASWLDLAKNLDSVTRVLITFMFEQAIESATDRNTKEWLEVILDTVRLDELKVVFSHLYQQETNVRKERIERLENRIGQLKSFEELCAPIRCVLENELNSLKKSEL